MKSRARLLWMVASGSLILYEQKIMQQDTKTFSHIDSSTGNPAMVGVGDKQVTKRVAKAESIVVLGEEIMQQFTNGDIQTKKGPVFQTAIIAGTMAAKK